MGSYNLYNQKWFVYAIMDSNDMASGKTIYWSVNKSKVIKKFKGMNGNISLVRLKNGALDEIIDEKVE